MGYIYIYVESCDDNLKDDVSFFPFFSYLWDN